LFRQLVKYESSEEEYMDAAMVANREFTEAQIRTKALGPLFLRYGLVLVIVWFAFMKFTDFGAHGIYPMVAKSPLMGWMYHFLSVRQFAACLGATELVVATLIALRPFSAKLCAIGSTAAMLMFLSTLSFMLSTPGWEPTLGGFPALGVAGQFLVKDFALFGIAFWSLGESWAAVRR